MTNEPTDRYENTNSTLLKMALMQGNSQPQNVTNHLGLIRQRHVIVDRLSFCGEVVPSGSKNGRSSL